MGIEMSHILLPALRITLLCLLGWSASAATDPVLPQAPASTPPAAAAQARQLLQAALDFHARKEHAEAIALFSRALTLDDSLDQAYLGRGLARGSSGLIDQGISDLSVFIARNPRSSYGYTKRGIRYLWKGDTESAYQDFLKAIALDPGNAEAFDDLGVIYAQRRDYRRALESFSTVIRLEPLYFKAHHNMALVYSILDQPELALAEVDKALQLKADARNSMRLKSVILERLGRHAQAHEAAEEAEFMPQENWTEVAPLK